jgi:hypothetical protein
MTGLLRSLPRAYIDHISLCLENKEEKANIRFAKPCNFEVDFSASKGEQQAKAVFRVRAYNGLNGSQVQLRVHNLPREFEGMRHTLLKTAMVEFHNEAIREAYKGLGGKMPATIIETDCFTDGDGKPCVISVVLMPSSIACLISRIEKNFSRAHIIALQENVEFVLIHVANTLLSSEKDKAYYEVKKGLSKIDFARQESTVYGTLKWTSHAQMEKAMAVVMGSHRRLGENSMFKHLDPYIVSEIAKTSITTLNTDEMRTFLETYYRENAGAAIVQFNLSSQLGQCRSCTGLLFM